MRTSARTVTGRQLHYTAVFLWFIVLAPVIVAEVFRSPMVDYRLVAVGAALPLLEVVSGVHVGLHTLLGSVAALTVVMVGTMNRRLVRRRLLGIPIGLFLHLALDGSWATKELFWWPTFGRALPAGGVGGVGMPLWLGMVSELAAIGVGYWAWQRYGLADRQNRQLLVRQGHLNRGVLT